jgi:DNA-binding transcriptional MerR regulator
VFTFQVLNEIGELAHKSGFRRSAIRFYESAGLLPPALRHNG